MNSTTAPSTLRSRNAESARQEEPLLDLLRAMQSVQAGDFSARVCTDWEGTCGKQGKIVKPAYTSQLLALLRQWLHL